MVVEHIEPRGSQLISSGRPYLPLNHSHFSAIRLIRETGQLQTWPAISASSSKSTSGGVPMTSYVARAASRSRSFSGTGDTMESPCCSADIGFSYSGSACHKDQYGSAKRGRPQLSALQKPS